MSSNIRRYLRQFVFSIAGLACFAAQADYAVTIVNYPGAVATQLWSINQSGAVMGTAQMVIDGPTVNFVYDSKTGAFGPPIAPSPAGTPPAGSTTLLGINNQGTMVGTTEVAVGSAPGEGAIRDTKGVYTSASLEGYEFTQFRGINESGFLAGFAQRGTDTTGFVYDSKRGRFTAFLPSPQTIAHGINSRGEVAGSVRLDNKTYAFVRSASGGFGMFQIEGRPTRARGINDSGEVAGYYSPASGGAISFVSNRTGEAYALIDVPNGSTAEGIDNSGVVVGIAGDSGFIAVPLKPNK